MRFKFFFIPAVVILFSFTAGVADVEKNAGENPGETIQQNQTNPGLPGGPSLKPDRFLRASQNLCYGISKEYGFLYSEDSGASWVAKNEGLPQKMIYPFARRQIRYLTALGADPANPGRVAVTTTKRIFLSGDFGENWQEIKTKKPIPDGAYLTAVALSPASKEKILIGTSFAGMFETRDFGRTWVNISEKLTFLYQGAGFWDEIAAVAYDPENPDLILFKRGFSNTIYQLSEDRKTVRELPAPETPTDSSITATIQAGPSPGTNASAPNQTSNGTVGEVSVTTITGTFPEEGVFLPEAVKDPEKKARLQRASNKYGIYLRADYARGKNLDDRLRFIKEKGLNAIVVDCKDDFGYLTYDTRLSFPNQVRAVRKKNFVNMAELLMKAHQKGIYVIGRIVVFQDPRLFEYRQYKYAAWDGAAQKPWRTKEFWVDPFAVDVWEYNVEIARELETLGIDEIQFDYIRFPTDGDIGRIVYRYQPEGSEKIDALESFLAYARARITLPISTDLYGFNCWCRVDGVNGQNLELIADYVDVVCPMFYPSHFPRNFMPGMDYLERARRIYSEGTSRAYSITNGRSIIRPYVQAFLLGGERKMTPPVYFQYLNNQIQGVLATDSPGFTLWNFANNYYMVNQSLEKYFERK